MPNAKRQILITSALPYANADLHLGYVLEAIQTDIWARFQKAQGHQVTYVSGDDAHGASVMLKAAELHRTEEEHCAFIYQRHLEDIKGFNIDLDFFHTTHSDENRSRSASIFKTLESKGMIQTKPKQQLYDPEKGMFLADRFVRGECPKCGAKDQYGDNCEVCSSTYEADELINPVSAFSGATPVIREVEQLYFDLPQHEAFLKAWLASGRLPSAVANKLNEWVNSGLKPWDISREAPYFGFEIPGHPGKYFYVWLDAPIGYMASFEAYCNSATGQRRGLQFSDYWDKNSQTELHHVVGKDIINFHGLFWPAMLDSAGYRLPTKIHVHGFVTIDGEKMSKSRGTFITARQYLDHFDADLIRYYFASKLNQGIDDVDLNLEEFAQKINTDLVGKVVNIASRCAKFINKQFDSQLCQLNEENLAHYRRILTPLNDIKTAYDHFEFAKAMRLIMHMADESNRLIDELKPWVSIKADNGKEMTHQTCSLGLHLFRALITCLAPVTPALAQRAAAFFQQESLDWQNIDSPMEQQSVANFVPLLARLDLNTLKTHLTATVNNTMNTSANEAPAKSTTLPEITIDDFMKLDLRVVTIISAAAVEGSDKLIETKVDIGNDETRTIFAGMATAYTPEQLVGRQVLALVNLKPRKMRFGTSEGMLLGAGPGGKEIFLLSPDQGAKADMNVQ